MRIGDDQLDQQDVRFLSQKFVERLSSDDHIGTELVSEIEAVVFSYLDPTDTLNASSFDELRALRTEGIRSEGQRLRDEVVRLIWTLLTKVETSCDRILIAGGANVEAEWEQGSAV